MERWLDFFESRNPVIRQSAAQVILDHGAAAPLAVFLEILDELHDKGLGAKAQRVLRERRDAELVSEMIARLGSSSWFVREVACEVLGELGDRAATPHLLAVLSNDSWRLVRRAAGWALANLADPTSGAAILAHYEERTEDINVLMALELALRALGVAFKERRP